MSMPSHTIKVTGVPEELVKLLDERVKRRHGAGRSEYIRELIRRDVLGTDPSLRDLLAPIHADTKRRGTTEAEVDQLVDELRSEITARSSSR